MQPQRVLIVGSGGMLGSELLRACSARHSGFHPHGGRPLEVVTISGAAEMDITRPASVHRILSKLRPDVVINAAAYTDVDGAEADFGEALRVNSDGPANLAIECRQLGALLVHFSTDYVFNGRAGEPYVESDATDPINAYGLSKLAGEQAIACSRCRHVLIRSCWLFAPHGRNFVRTILHLARERDTLPVVADQRGRPTHCADLADMTLRYLEARQPWLDKGREVSDVVHAACSGPCSWFDFARETVAAAELDCEVVPCTSASFPRPARRPMCSVLDTSKLADAIGAPPHWRESLEACVREAIALERGDRRATIEQRAEVMARESQHI